MVTYDSEVGLLWQEAMLTLDISQASVSDAMCMGRRF